MGSSPLGCFLFTREKEGKLRDKLCEDPAVQQDFLFHDDDFLVLEISDPGVLVARALITGLVCLS
jgi:hypothetical protein